MDFLGCISLENGIIEKINNDSFFISDNVEKIYLIKKEEKKDNILSTKFDKKIYSVYASPNKTLIYACLANERKVQIFNYNLKAQELKINNNEIKEENFKSLNFNKCIDIGNEYLVTADNFFINIWFEKNGNFSKIKTYAIFKRTSDLLQANKDYFISIQPNKKTITIFNIKSLNQEKILTNIDSIDSNNSLLLYKDYIIINCNKGIALFYIKTKEIIQNIENYRGIIQKEIFLDNNDNICILYIEKFNSKYLTSLVKFKMDYGSFEALTEYEEKEINGKFLKILNLKDYYYILSDEYLDILEDSN